MADMPANLGALYLEAQKDLGAGDPRTVVKWGFWHARYASNVKMAERDLREFDNETACVRVHAAGQLGEDMRLAVMANGPNPTEVGRAMKTLADAYEMESASAYFHDLLKARTMGTAVKAAPPLRVIDGGQK